MLNHPFILHLEATFQDEHTLYMLIELVRGGELFNYLEKQEKERYHQMILSQLNLLTACAIKASEIKEESLSSYELAVKA